MKDNEKYLIQQGIYPIPEVIKYIRLSNKILSEISSTFRSTKIGGQIWMNNNLDVEYFVNGDKIIEAKSDEEWNNACRDGIPAWCHFEYDKSNDIHYGKVYNYYSIHDSRNLCPKEWKIPQNEDFQHLIYSATSENNRELIESFFLEAIRMEDGKFVSMKKIINNLHNGCDKNTYTGHSVRCFKNDYSLKYKYFELNNKFWTADHLNVTKFRNGDPIFEANSDEDWIYAGEQGIPAYCKIPDWWLNFRDIDFYGYIYNWYAITDPRLLVPKGLKIPTTKEYEEFFKSTKEHEIADSLWSLQKYSTLCRYPSGEFHLQRDILWIQELIEYNAEPNQLFMKTGTNIICILNGEELLRL